jgi:hypothetical protein
MGTKSRDCRPELRSAAGSACAALAMPLRRGYSAPGPVPRKWGAGSPSGSRVRPDATLTGES